MVISADADVPGVSDQFGIPDERRVTYPHDPAGAEAFVPEVLPRGNLRLNSETSGAGGIQVEIQDADGVGDLGIVKFPNSLLNRIIMSPTVFREKGYRFYFLSNEENRIHIHVTCADGEAKFWIEPIISLALYQGLNRGQLSEIQDIIEEHEDEIRKSWEKHFHKR